MANIFFSVNAEIVMGSEEDEDVVALFSEKKSPNNLSVILITEDDRSIGFELGEDNSDGGQIEATPDGSVLRVKCEGVYKVKVKSDLESDVLNPDAVWIFDGLSGVEGSLYGWVVNEGLEEEEYEYKRRGNVEKGIRWRIKIKTASKKGELSST